MKAQTGAEPYGSPDNLMTVRIAKEQDVVTARQRAREIARLLGFGQQDQIRIATATSEIGRNAVQYAGGGVVEFCLSAKTDGTLFLVRVSDRGPGISDTETILRGTYHSETGMGLGLVGTRRLMDIFSVESVPGKGATVTFGKMLPAGASGADIAQISQLSEQLTQASEDSTEELKRLNQELLTALSMVRAHELELERRATDLERLNQELQETNRGVVALYAELDDKAAALRRADEVKSRFLSHMSHEFRTPLNSILALAQLLIRRIDGDLTPEQDKQVSLIRRSADELLEMVNDLLDLAKVEAGKVDLRLAKIEVLKLLGALRAMMRPLLSNEAVALVFDPTPEKLIINTDEGKVSQILRNLISNALKFTERGEVRVSVECGRDRILFRVSDTGIGIARENQELIFQEFSQVDHTLQRKVKGTGLGLPLSRKLAEFLGGTLTVTSEPGIGSTFCLALPASVVEGRDILFGELGSSGSASGNQAGKREASELDSILVIDDEEVSRYLVRQFFRGTPYVITEAAGGIEGLERARFDRPRLIILDLNMPDRNGFEVLEELKADPSTKDIPVVIRTSRSLQPQDMLRLAGRHAAVLTKRNGNESETRSIMRQVLGDSGLFED